MQSKRTQNLQAELQEQLFLWTLTPLLMGGLLVALISANLADRSFLPLFGLLVMGVAGGLAVIFRYHKRTGLLLYYAVGLGLIILAGRLFPEAQVHLATFFVVAVAGVLSGPKVCLAVLAANLLVLAISRDASGASLLTQLAGWLEAAALAAVAFVLCIAQRPQAAYLSWAWESYDQARADLARARDRQIELKQALQDLDLANHEVMRLNDLLSAAREAIEEARRAKETFVANVSHELRTPLNMVIGYSDEILERPDLYAQALPDELLTDIGAIKRNAEHLAHLVDDVLDLSEADAGYTHLSKTWVSVPELIADIKDSMQGLFAKKQLTLGTDLAPDLPLVYCDRLRIRQVILNLISNAARFTMQGGATIRAYHQDELLTIEVTDTGPGIESQALQRLFEPFQQGDPSIRRRYGGTGLGLAISKRFVEMHGGEITLSSQVGQGTTVAFSLSVAEQDRPDNAARWFGPYTEYEARTRRSRAAVSQPKPRVLVVEPEPGLAPLLAHSADLLEISAVPSLEEAKARLDREPLAGVVINSYGAQADLTLPLKLPTAAFDIPVFSCALPPRVATTAMLGAEAYLIKPIRRGQLLEAIATHAPQARRVLICDDDSEARHLYSRMLSDVDHSYEILTVHDGQSALQAMAAWQPAVVLLDLVMPDVDGLAVLAQRAREPGLAAIPVIVVSARDSQQMATTSPTLVTSRQMGLGPADLAQAIAATITALPPRYAVPAEPETLAP